MRKILILMGRYLPGYKDGGPLRTIVNVTEALGDEYEFYIAALDRDHGDATPYLNIIYDEWNNVGKAKVWYVRPGEFSFGLIKGLAASMDVVYTCGFFDDYGYKALLLHRFGLLGKPLNVASMGSFSHSAMEQKALKKKVFILLCKALGLFRNICWSVTSELEAEDLKRIISPSARYIVAEDLPRTKVPGIQRDDGEQMRIVFLSRICRHKGLELAIDAVAKMDRKNIKLTICGPIQELDYWQHCVSKMEEMTYKWEYFGDIPSEEVQSVLAQQDVLVLPTKSENYGHVIFEALSVGCIPVISDRTPWASVAERGAGYVLPLEQKHFTAALNALASKTASERETMALAGVALAREKVETTMRETGYRKIFG